MEVFITIMLILHISSGFLALITGFLSMLNTKGGKRHRLTGKLFFAGMSGVFVSATVLSIVKNNQFLLMVGFLSYYLACSGYRSLYLKKLHLKQKPRPVDWLISGTAFLFGIGFFALSARQFISGNLSGIVPLAFGTFCLINSIKDIRSFYIPPTKKQHWILTHGARMGGSFAATVTAFIVVNGNLGSFSWILWILPGVLIGIWISKLLKPYNKNAGA